MSKEASIGLEQLSQTCIHTLHKLGTYTYMFDSISLCPSRSPSLSLSIFYMMFTLHKAQKPLEIYITG